MTNKHGCNACHKLCLAMAEEGSPGVWVGGNDRETEGVWKWEDSGDPVPHWGWLCGQPNNGRGGQDCMMMSLPHKGRFDDTSCSEELMFFCELV